MRGREAVGRSAPPGTCTRPGPSSRGARDPRDRSGPSSALQALPAPARSQHRPPPIGSPAHPRIPSSLAPGELTTCSSTWELMHQEGFLPTPQATPSPCGVPAPGARGWRRGAGRRRVPKLRLRSLLPARWEHYTMVEAAAAAAAAGRQRRRKREAGGGGALTERAAARAPALAVQE